MIGNLGVLVVRAEYGTGTIRVSLAAVPNRRLFLVAKATTFAMVAFLVGEFASFVAFFAGQSLISGGAPHATITQSGVLGAVIGSGLYLTLLGLLAVGLGLIIRHTAGALAAFVGVLLIVSLLTPAFPSSIQDAISKFEPTTIGSAMEIVCTHLPKGRPTGKAARTPKPRGSSQQSLPVRVCPHQEPTDNQPVPHFRYDVRHDFDGRSWS